MCDLTVTPTGYSKQNKMTTSIRDLSPKEGLQGANFKWSPFSLLLLIAKYNLPLDPHHWISASVMEDPPLLTLDRES